MAEEHYDDYIETVDRRGRELVRTLRELHDYGSGYMIDIRDNVRNIEETEAGPKERETSGAMEWKSTRRC